MMRVLHVVHYPVFSGPHNQALRLAEPLRARGVDLTVLLPDEPGNAACRLAGAGVDVVTIPLHRLRESLDPRLHAALLLRLGAEISSIRRVIRDRQVDIVQIVGLVNPHAALAARAERVPVVWQLVDTRAPRIVASVAMMFVRALSSVVMSTGTSVAAAHPGGDALRGRLVPFFPPVDTDLFRPRPAERTLRRDELGIPHSVPVVGCVANINPQKGIVELIEAFADVRRHVNDARLVLVGAEYRTHGAYSALVRRQLDDAGLREGTDVLFLGERDDVERVVAAFDVFAFAPVPRGEGISTVVLEAMSAGLPVVTTSVAGLAEAIEDGVDGKLVAPSDPAAMSAAIVGLLTNAEAARTLGERARETAVSRFAVERSVDAHVRAYAVARTARAGTRSLGHR